MRAGMTKGCAGGLHVVSIAHCTTYIQHITYYSCIMTKPSNSDTQTELAKELIKVPVPNAERFEKIWSEQVYTLKGEYEMQD